MTRISQRNGLARVPAPTGWNIDWNLGQQGNIHVLRHRIAPISSLGKALHYAHDQWPHLETCFEHGQVDFDNNSLENAIHPTKLDH